MGQFLSSVQVAVRNDEDVAAVRLRVRGRTALVRAGAWLGVYAEEAEQDIAALESLAAEFSRVTPRAVAVMVHDSDFLWMSLAEKGRIVDRFTDSPEEPASGNPRKWGEARLRQVWNTDAAFAEDKLARAAEVLRIPEQLVLAGTQHLPPEAEWLEPAAPAHPSAGVRLEPAAPLVPPSRPVVGEQFGVQVAFHNAGAAFTGLAVELSGPALSLIALRQGHMFVAAASVRMARAHPAVAALPEDGAFYFSRWEAPAGVVCGFSLLCEARREGAADLMVRITPEGGEPLEHVARVEVLAAPRLPLRSVPGPNAFFYLKQMREPRALSGVAILRAGRAPELLPYLRDWIGDGEATARTIKRSPGFTLSMPRPKKHRVDAAAWGAGLLKAAATAQTVRVEVEKRGALLAYSLQDNEARCPHLAFWSYDHADRPRLRTLLESLMERDGLQAFLARWDWIPEFDTLDGYSNTPYEMACGARHGADYMTETWCARYLRAVGEETWLGPGLQQLAGTVGRHVATNEDALTPVEERLAAVLPGPAEF
ncbi:MAG: hypothetical protein SFV54_16590 [Bryobacteraceae bacterium]|nr:hypothetical protein [Bryobacteraceae bacterium]